MVSTSSPPSTPRIPPSRCAEALTWQSTSIRAGRGAPTESQTPSTKANKSGSAPGSSDRDFGPARGRANSGLSISATTIAPAISGRDVDQGRELERSCPGPGRLEDRDVVDRVVHNRGHDQADDRDIEQREQHHHRGDDQRSRAGRGSSAGPARSRRRRPRGSAWGSSSSAWGRRPRSPPWH